LHYGDVAPRLGFIGKNRANLDKFLERVKLPGLYSGQEGTPFVLVEDEDRSRSFVLSVPDAHSITYQPGYLETVAVVTTQGTLLPHGLRDVLGTHAVPTVISVV
jgi:hypothetical protein